MSCIVVFRQPDRIVLAADSMATRGRADRRQLETRVLDDDGKILSAGRWTLATCGFSAGPGLPDVRAAIGRAISATSTMADALAAVQRVFVRQLAPSLMKARFYPSFRDVFEAIGGSVLAVFVAGRDADGTLTVGSFGADITDLKTFNVRMYGGTCPGVMGAGDAPFYFSTGQQLASDLANTEPRPDWLARGDGDAARRLIEMQIEATPDRCARPVHVVEITHNGITRSTA